MAKNGEEYEEEERYADSAMWKIIQQNTFTRWTNEHLKEAKLDIKNMEKDFADGLKLIQLIQVLSGKKFARYNKKPSFRTQKFENVTMCLKFLEEKEGIKLVNIDSSDIVDQKLKLIMGLIWTLILHYSITMSWEDDSNPFFKEQTPKQRLLAWIQGKIPEKNITNFMSDWNDGTAIAALVDALAPGLVPDAPTMDPKQRIPNAKQGMEAAEKWMDVPQVIKPEEMCNPNVDELSMMTYLSRFPSARLKSGSPAVQKPNAHRIKAYGPGIELDGNVVGFPARFIVETASAGTGELEVNVENPKGGKEKVELLANNDRTISYNCLYLPTMDGQYKVSIKWAGQLSTKQPYLVNVTSKAGDPAKVTAQGPGIEKTGVHVNRKTYFEVFTKGAGVGVVDVGVVDPQNKAIKSVITKKSDDVWYVEYTAETPGLHSVNINFAGKPIPKSPYPVGVGAEGGPAVDASRLPGKPVSISPRDVAAVSIATPLKAAPGSTAPKGDADPQAKKPGQMPVTPLQVKPEEAQPKQPAVPEKPNAAAKPEDKLGAPAAKIPVNSKNCWASGKGIQPKGNRLGESPTFHIHSENAGTADPRAMVMGPGGTPVQNTLKKINDDLHDCTYKPTKAGLHIINVTFGGSAIQKSPFRVDIGAHKISKVEAFGPGLESGVVNQPATFTVKPNGEGPIGFKIEGPSQAKIDVTKNADQTEMYVTYYPTVAGEYAVRILSKNDDIPKSPYMVPVTDTGAVASKPSVSPSAPGTVDASKVTASGPGLEKEGNVVGKWAEFTVDATKAGKAELRITAVDREMKMTEVTILDNTNLTFSCKYLPIKPTTYTITIHYAAKAIPKSPFLVNVKDSGMSSSKVKVFGPALEKPVQAKLLTYYIIDCKEAGTGEPQVTLKNDKGLAVVFQKKDLKDRTYRVEFTAPMPGVYTTTVTFGGQAVPKSPFSINVLSSPDASKVKVYGPALEKPVNVNELSHFIVDCKEAGQGEPRVVVMSAKGVTLPTKMTDHGDRTYKVELTAPVAGVYNANVQFASKPVPKSPFKINVQATVQLSQVFVKDLPEFVPVSKETPFEVVTAGAGPGKVRVVITSPSNKPVPSLLNEKPNVSTGVKFTPLEQGPHKVEVFFAEKPVAKSPFTVTAQMSNPFNVRVYGPAVEKPVFVNEVTFFVVDCKEAGPGQPQIKLTDEKGQAMPFNVLDQKDMTFRIEFTPISPGSGKAEVLFDNQPVNKSPYVITILLTLDFSKVKVYGPALEKPVPVKYLSYFTIDCKEAGPGTPAFTLRTEEDNQEVVGKLVDNRDGTFRVEFVPQNLKPIQACVFFLGQPHPKNPYKISVGSDDGKVKVYGPAVEAAVPPKVTTHFIIDCKEAGPGQPQVQLIDEPSKQAVPFTLEDNKDGTFNTTFTPQSLAPLQAHVSFNAQAVPKSPFRVQVSASPACRVKVFGPAVEGPVEFQKPTEFTVDTTQAGPAVPEIALVDDVTKAPVHHQVTGVTGKFKVEFTPTTLNPISAQVTYQKQPVPKSPFKIIVGKKDPSKVKMYGPALEGPVKTNLPTHFTIDTKEAGPVKPAVSMVTEDNKTPVTFTPVDKKDGTYDVKFTPKEVKPIIAQVTADNQQVPKSPFRIPVVQGPAVDPTKVKVTGPAIEGAVKCCESTHVNIDCKEAGVGTPMMRLEGTDGSEGVAIKMVDNHDGTFQAHFTPTSPHPLTAHVTFSTLPVPQSPFTVNILPVTSGPCKVKVYGPAIEAPVMQMIPTHFIVDAKEAGPGQPVVSVTTPQGIPLPINKNDNRDGTYKVDFTPNQVGVVLANVSFTGKPVPGSPFKVAVEPKSNPVRISNLPKSITVGQPAPFNIITSGPKKGPVDVQLISPRGIMNPAEIFESPEGVVARVTAQEPGPHKVAVKVANEAVEGSPFPVEALPQQTLTFAPTPSNVIDPSKVKAYGPGLKGGTVNKPCDFTIDTSEAGPGNLGLTIDGPTEAKIECFDKGAGVFDVRYLPNEPGEYTINITFDEAPIPHSPFKSQVNPEILVDVSGVITYGPGVQPTGVFLDSVTEFTVDTKSVQPKGTGHVKAILTSPSGTLTEAIVKKNEAEETYTCLYTPFEAGMTKIDVTYDGLKVPRSPFVTDVQPGCDAAKVKVYGPGIEKGEPNVPARFTINTRGAGLGGVGLSVVGPTEPKVDCVDNQDGTLSVEYLPDSAGDYEIGITFADQPVPGSSFIVPIGSKPQQQPLQFQPQQPQQLPLQQQPQQLQQQSQQQPQQPQQLPQQQVFPERVKCFGPGINPQGVKQGQPTPFTILPNQPVNAPVLVTVTETNTGMKLPVQMNRTPTGTYDVAYIPPREGPLRVDVLYGGQVVPGSPFNTVSKPALDLSKVVVTGDGVKPQLPASIPVAFNVDTRQAAPMPLPVQVEMKNPQGKVSRPKLMQLAPGVVQATYTPDDAGPYQLSVKVAEREIPASPIRVTAVPTGNSENVVVPDNIPTSLSPGQMCFFKVNKPSTSGLGNVTCKVTKAGQPGQPGTDIPANVQDNHDGTVTVSYKVPDNLDDVIISEVKFGGVLVPRGRFTQKVGRPGEGSVPAVNAKVTTGGIPPSPATAPFSITSSPFPTTPTSPNTPFRLVEVPSIPVGPNINQVTAQVVTPSGNTVPVPVVAGTEEGSIRVVYNPTEAGPHILKVLYAGQPVPGDPFSFFVHASKPGQVVAFGPGLISGRVNHECVFTVVTKNAGPGGLALAIEGPSKAEISCRDNKDGSATITYVPTTPGEYKVIVKHGGQPITGAPFIAKITGEDRTIFTRSSHSSNEQSSITRQSHVTVGSTRHLTIQVTEHDLSNLSAVIRSPSGQEEPCGLKRQPNGQLGISFTPRESGEHLVTVFRNGSPIPGSPFRIIIQATEVGDASRVKVYGQNISTANANEFNEFTIHTREAGVAGLSISVQGPGKVEIKCTETEEGNTKVCFKPTEPGIYNVTIKYGDKPVPGSPFTITVAGIPSGRVKERIVRQQQAASASSVGTTCELNITMPGIKVNEIEGTVQSPSGKQDRCQIVDLGENRFKISFSPTEAGVHYVSLKHKGMHIPGSPFQFTVGPIVGGGPEKVRAVGPGLERGQANKPCHFTVITREAGAGSLSLGVEGPSKAIIDFQDRRDGTSDVNYLCSEPGEYLVSVKFNGQHIIDSPFKVYVSSSEHDNNCNVRNFQQHGLPINTQTQFLVELTGIQGRLEAKVVAPSGIETPANVQETAPGRFSVTFVPKEGGIHYVHLLLNGNHVSGSPYPVQVGVITADPTKVRAYGDGLYKGQSGHPCKFIVNTTESGPGALSVGISGPSKVELNTREVEEGYEFTYTPLAPGPYLITIKYAGNSHIQGSPFKAQIEGVGTPAAFVEQSRLVVETVTKTTSRSLSNFNSDSSKVAVTGNGLSQLFVNQEAVFMVDGSQAGYNMLWVGVSGPHIPVDKIFVTHLGNLRYSVKYQVSQPGAYQLFIKWGDQLIPGCPFNMVAK